MAEDVSSEVEDLAKALFLTTPGMLERLWRSELSTICDWYRQLAKETLEELDKGMAAL